MSRAPVSLRRSGGFIDIARLAQGRPRRIDRLRARSKPATDRSVPATLSAPGTR
jgi:hypothetical protein